MGDGDCSGWAANEVSIETGTAGGHVTVYDIAGTPLVATGLGDEGDPPANPDGVTDTLVVAPRAGGCDMWIDFTGSGGGVYSVVYPNHPVIIEVSTSEKDPAQRTYTRYAFATTSSNSSEPVSFFYADGGANAGPDLRLLLHSSGDTYARPANSSTYINDILGNVSWVMPYNWTWFCSQASGACGSYQSTAFLAPVSQLPDGESGLVLTFADGTDVAVPSGMTTSWAVEGMTLKFHGDRRLVVRGSLTAEEITFTAQDPQTPWSGITVAGSGGLLQLSNGSVVEHAGQGVTVYDPARAFVTGGATLLQDNDIGLLVLSTGGGAPNFGAVVEDAQILENETGVRMDYTCTWNSGSAPNCEAEESEVRSRVRLEGSRLASSEDYGLYALNGNRELDQVCVEDNDASGMVVANATLSPVLRSTITGNGAAADGYGAAVHSAGSLLLSPTEDVGRSRITSNATSEFYVWNGGTLFLGESSASGQNRVTDSGSLIYAAYTSVHVDARRTYWTGSAPPGGSFPGPGTVDAADHRTTDVSSDVCNASLMGGPQEARMETPDHTGPIAYSHGDGEHQQELRRLRGLLEQATGGEAAALVRALAVLQRADRGDALGERSETMALFARMRGQLDNPIAGPQLRPGAEAALEAELMASLEGEEYQQSRVLVTEYQSRVLDEGVQRSMELARAYLAAQAGQRAEASAIVEGVAVGLEDPIARREMYRLAAALADDFGGLERPGQPDAPPSLAIGDGPDIDVSVSPNPARGSATLRLSLEHPSRTRIDVVDLLGRVVQRVATEWLESGSHAYRLELSGLPSGMYLVRVVTEAGSGRTERVVRATFLR